MPRKLRHWIAGVPQHIILRGHNKQPIFMDDSDRLFWQETVAKYAKELEIAIHAYVWMDNHVHLLVTTPNQEAASRWIQSVGRTYVARFNTRHQRSGTLWEGRFKSSLVDSETYLITCMRYIELNPVRAGIVSHPKEYPWSSWHTNAEGEHNTFITPHPVYLAYSKNRLKRCEKYKEAALIPIKESDLLFIRQAINSGAAIGSEAFIARANITVGDDLTPRKRGRPKKRKEDDDDRRPKKVSKRSRRV
ncbi:MAG: transposase [Campylobacterales bacterium]